jgi:hypothetical protein
MKRMKMRKKRKSTSKMIMMLFKEKNPMIKNLVSLKEKMKNGILLRESHSTKDGLYLLPTHSLVTHPVKFLYLSPQLIIPPFFHHPPLPQHSLLRHHPPLLRYSPFKQDLPVVVIEIFINCVYHCGCSRRF